MRCSMRPVVSPDDTYVCIHILEYLYTYTAKGKKKEKKREKTRVVTKKVLICPIRSVVNREGRIDKGMEKN